MATTGSTPLGRCIRFAPPELPDRGPGLARWREKHVPTQWRSPDQHILFVRVGAADLNARYGEMLDELANSRCPSEPSDVLPRLALELIRQGENAREWIAGGEDNDPNERRRAADSRFLEDIPAVISAARRLARHLRQEQTAFPVNAALRSSNVRVVPTDDREFLPGELLAEFLQVYGPHLREIHTARRGPFLHRTQVGPFVFPEAIDGAGRRRGAGLFATSTAVMFGAVLAARQATGGGGGQAGDLMPQTGMPLYAVAAALVRAVTADGDVDANEVRTRLKTWKRRNPMAGWIGWPNGYA
jgi:hypothetical protein